ncbi:hypothetical protein LguiA_022430 [Lonicera macranthoides]
MAHSISSPTKLALFLFLLLTFLTILEARVPNSNGLDSLTLFTKLGFTIPSDKGKKGSLKLSDPLREAPGGPDPIHHGQAPPPSKDPLRDAPGGPDPIHHGSATPLLKDSFRHASRVQNKW